MARASEATQRVALGFRVRTGRATAVVLAGPVSAPRVLDRRELVIHDPRLPDSFQPWHAVLELSGGEAERALRRATEAARRAALPAVRGFVEAAGSAGGRPRGAGIVMGSDTDPSSIANPHMRAHAEEGRYFPNLVEEALEECGLSCARLLEREVRQRACAALGRKEAELERALVEVRKAVGPPFGAREKAATLAAWIVLAQGGNRG